MGPTPIVWQALALFQHTSERAGETHTGNSIGEAMAVTGRWSEARAHHHSALTLAVEIGDHYQRARAHAGLAGRTR
jgi:hypothetical protein